MTATRKPFELTLLHKVFWIALLIKLALAAALPLTNDEAYYWVWSQHMQLSFFDHPPIVAWLFWLGDHLGDPHLVRWPAVLLGHGTLALWLILLRPFFDDSKRLCWLFMALFSPLVGGTNLLVTPDLPLLFFYALSMWVFYRWREKPHWSWALFFGLSMGLGFSAKYMMVLFPLSLFPLLVLSRQIRGPLFRQFGWIILGALLGALPVWLWNLLNDFISLRFQADHGLGAAWKPSWTIEYVLAQVGLIFPIVLYWALRAGRRLPAIFHLMAWVPLVFFFCTTFGGYVEANWPIAAYPAVFALAVTSWPRGARSLQLTIALWAVVVSSLFAIIIFRPVWSRPMKFREFHQFDSLVQPVQSLSPLFARSYQMAAKLHFALQRPVFKLKSMNRKDFYDFLEESDPGSQNFYLAVEKGDELPVMYLARGYKVAQVIPVDDQFEIWQVTHP